MQFKNVLFFITSLLYLPLTAVSLFEKQELANLPGPKEITAYVIDVYDGDTCTVITRVWGEAKQSIIVTEAVRMYGIDTPELRTTDLAEKERGYAAKQFTADRILGKIVRLELVGREKFGRLMATIFYKDANGNEINLNQELIQNGHAQEYFGGKRSYEDNDPYDRED